MLMPHPGADDQAKVPQRGAKVQGLEEADGPEQQARGRRCPDAAPQRATAHNAMSLATSMGVTDNHMLQGRHARHAHVKSLMLCLYFSNVPEVQLRSTQRHEHQYEEDAAKQEVHGAEGLPQVWSSRRRLLHHCLLVNCH
jgi:hypothetical protein